MKTVRVKPIKKNKKDILKNTRLSDDTNEIKSFITIIIILVVSILVIYFVTEAVGKKNNKGSEVAQGTINYDVISIGMLLNRPYDEYFVIIYDSTTNDAMLYETLVAQYNTNNNKEKVKLFYCDLNNVLNKKYYNVKDDNISNPKAKSIEELDLGNLTLIKVKNGKIVNYLETYNSIENLLTEN